MMAYPFTRYLVAALGFCLAMVAFGSPARSGEPQLAHMVYFTLQDPSDKNKDALVAACQKYLAGHEGTVYYSAGVLADDLNRDVNDRRFDVCLNLIFKNKAAHDQYSTNPRHLRFIKENKQLWSKVRVFDSYLAPPPSGG